MWCIVIKRVFLQKYEMEQIFSSYQTDLKRLLFGTFKGVLIIYQKIHFEICCQTDIIIDV